MNTPLQKQKSRFHFLMIVVAVIWLFRGLDLVSTGVWYGYVWIKRGFPAADLEALNEVTFPQWVRIVMFFVGLIMLYTQLYAQRADTKLRQNQPNETNA